MKFSLLLLFSLFIGMNFYAQPSSSQTQFDTDIFVDLIIEKLAEHATYEGDQLQGWLYRYNSPSFRYELIYNGYTTGAAGIGDFLIDAYNAGFDTALPLISQIVDHYVLSGQSKVENHTYWTRFANLGSYGWTGNRYGSSGILTFLSRAFELGGTNVTDLLLDHGVNWMMSTQDKYGYWPISEDSYVTTGIDYGASGMGYSLLKLYQITLNTIYLDYSKLIADYLIDIAIIDDLYVRMSWTPAVDDPTFLGERFSGIAVGEAGIMEYFYSLYKVTEESKYLDIALGLAQDLLALDLGGYWPKGTVGYINPLRGDSTGMVGFRVGATGISYELLQLYIQNGGSDYLNSALNTIDFVEQYLHADGSVSAGLDLEEHKLTGFGLGAAGVANYFIELYKFSNNPLHYAYAERILSHLYDLMMQYGLVPINEGALNEGYSFNQEDGIAGIGLAVINFMSVVPPENPHTFPTYTSTPPSVSTSDPTPSESTLRVSYFPYSFLLLLIPITVASRKLRS